MRLAIFVASLLLSSLSVLIPRGAADTIFHYTSDAGDYIGQGQERTFNITDGYVLSASRNYDGGVSFSFSFNNNASAGFEDSEYWNLDLATADGTALGVGDYEGAQRFAFHDATHPGLELSGAGRGSNTLTGNFQVLEAAFDTSGNVLRFAANFEQHSEGGPPPCADKYATTRPCRCQLCLV